MIRLVVMMSALQTGCAHPTSTGGADQRGSTALRDPHREDFFTIFEADRPNAVIRPPSVGWESPLGCCGRCDPCRADALRSGTSNWQEANRQVAPRSRDAPDPGGIGMNE